MADLVFDIALSRAGRRFAYAATIPAGGMTAIMGPSGVGKTTLLTALAGLAPDVEGRIELGGASWLEAGRSLPPQDRRIGFVFQEGRLFRHLSVAQNLAYGARRRGVAPARVSAIAEALGIAPLMARRPSTLSGGEARRVALGRALAADPAVLFLDEPLSGLDEAAKEALYPYIERAVSDLEIPVLYVTHIRSEVMRLATRVLRIEAGGATGWDAPPLQVPVPVLAASGGLVTIELKGRRLTLPGSGTVGREALLVIAPEALVLSRRDPGPSAALAVLEVQAVGEGADVRLGPHRLALSLPEGSAMARETPSPGARLFLSLLAGRVRG